jgi:hypothetical protein
MKGTRDFTMRAFGQACHRLHLGEMRADDLHLAPSRICRYPPCVPRGTIPNVRHPARVQFQSRRGAGISASRIQVAYETLCPYERTIERENNYVVRDGIEVKNTMVS